MNELKTIEEWKKALEQSREQPILVLKHSTTCPISAAGHKEYQAFETDIQKYYVIVQTSKEVSGEIAEDLEVKHESPQAILIKNEKAVWVASHYDIQQSNLEKAVSSVK